MKFSHKDYLVIAATLLVVVTSSLLLYLFSTASRGDRKNTEVVGYISHEENITERKNAGGVLWEELSQDQPVYNNDTIRTAEGSTALISLKNGAEINLDENTLIVLSDSRKGLGIDFSRGNISARGGGSGLSIRSDNTVVNLAAADVSLKKTEGADLSLDRKSVV